MTDFEPKIEIKDGKEYIFCAWRYKFVRLTPEEWVRQYFLHRLEDKYHYPHHYIAVEVQLKNRRADAVIYKRDMTPFVLIEFKSDRVSLDERVIDQLAVYNVQLRVPYLFLSNGEDTLVAKIENRKYHFIDYIPEWKQLFS